MILTHIDLKNVSLIYRKIQQKVLNGKGLMYFFTLSVRICYDNGRFLPGVPPSISLAQ